jgi:hypothetical protein
MRDTLKMRPFYWFVAVWCGSLQRLTRWQNYDAFSSTCRDTLNTHSPLAPSATIGIDRSTHFHLPDD